MKYILIIVGIILLTVCCTAWTDKTAADERTGAFVEYTCQMPGDAEESTDELMATAVDAMKKRLNMKHFDESGVKRVGRKGIRVEAMGISPEELINLTGSHDPAEFTDREGSWIIPVRLVFEGAGEITGISCAE